MNEVQRLNTIHETFHVEIYIKLFECKIAYLLCIFYNLIVLYYMAEINAAR